MVRIPHEREMFTWPFTSVLSFCWFDKSKIWVSGIWDLKYFDVFMVCKYQTFNVVCLFSLHFRNKEKKA